MTLSEQITPGPWYADGRLVKAGAAWAHACKNPGAGMRLNTVANVAMNTKDDRDMALANAKAIAALPDLLAFMEQLAYPKPGDDDQLCALEHQRNLAKFILENMHENVRKAAS